MSADRSADGCHKRGRHFFHRSQKETDTRAGPKDQKTWRRTHVPLFGNPIPIFHKHAHVFSNSVPKYHQIPRQQILNMWIPTR